MSDKHRGTGLIIVGIILASVLLVSAALDIPGLISDSIFAREIARVIAPTPPQAASLTPSAGGLQTLVPGEGTPAAAPTPTVRAGYVPDRIVIPAIDLDAPVVPATSTALEIRDQWFEQWNVPDQRAAGWQITSAPLGQTGNTVLGGHHNEYGKVFGRLVDLEIGDVIYLHSGSKVFTYLVTDRQLLQEADVSLDIRKANAVWISPTTDERVTLVTCWPRRNNTHRLIIVAHPIGK
jgi:sortase A